MPNAQPEPAVDPADMDLDETTFVTLVTAASQVGSPTRSDVPSVQTPGGVRHSHTQGQDADDENSDTPAVPSPSFSGFHSAVSSPGTRLGGRFNGDIEETNLDGHTLIEEPSAFTLIEEPSVLDNSNQDYSALSFLSANQSVSDQPSESQHQDRQVVDESLLAANGSGGNDSLLSVVPAPADNRSGKSSPARSALADSPNGQKASPPKSASWESILGLLRTGNPELENTDQDKEDELNEDHEDQDSLVHSEHSLRLSQPSPPSSSRSSRKPPTSAQRPQSQKSNAELSDAPAASTRSKKPASSPPPNASQLSEIIDLTSSPSAEASTSARKTKSDVSGWVSKPDGDDDLPSSGRQTRASTDTQLRVEVAVSPALSKASKKSKKRSSRKF
jgi:hypothetical protein